MCIWNELGTRPILYYPTVLYEVLTDSSDEAIQMAWHGMAWYNVLVLERNLDEFNYSRKYEYFKDLMIVLYCMSGKKEGALSFLHTICAVCTNT